VFFLQGVLDFEYWEHVDSTEWFVGAVERVILDKTGDGQNTFGENSKAPRPRKKKIALSTMVRVPFQLTLEAIFKCLMLLREIIDDVVKRNDV
jgi:hypothetical protein